MTRKNRLQIFNEKMKKQHFDQQAFDEEKLKGSTVENVGKRVAEKHGVSTEDIFAIVTRDSMEAFVKLWNNSMEDVIKTTIRNEIKTVVKEVVQEELLGAYKGILKGMASKEIAIQEEVVEKPVLRSVATMVQEETEDIDIYKKLKSIITNDMGYTQVADILIDHGIDPSKGTNFTKIGGHSRTLYLSFMKNNKGIKNAWKVMMQGHMKDRGVKL